MTDLMFIILLFVAMTIGGFIICTMWARELLEGNVAPKMQRVLAILALVPVGNCIGVFLLFIIGFMGSYIEEGFQTIKTILSPKKDAVELASAPQQNNAQEIV